jgi:hypothetical protein
MKRTVTVLLLAATAVLLGTAGPASAASLLFDRGLPAANLNAPAGADRSNVTWWSSNTGGDFVGDDFSIGTAGELYVIDSLTVWGAQYDPLSDDISNITLWFGKQGTQLSAVSTGNVTGNSNSNPDISHSFVTYADGTTSTYFATNAGFPFPIAQTTFSNLNLTVDGGDIYDFGIAAEGNFGWFGHASNAALGGVAAAGADGLYRVFDSTGVFQGSIDSSLVGWDKSSDINVQIRGQAIPEPASLGIFGMLAVLGASIYRRRPKRGARAPV